MRGVRSNADNFVLYQNAIIYCEIYGVSYFPSFFQRKLSGCCVTKSNEDGSQRQNNKDVRGRSSKMSHWNLLMAFKPIIFMKPLFRDEILIETRYISASYESVKFTKMPAHSVRMRTVL